MGARRSTSAGLIGMICAIVLVPTYAMPQQTQPGTFRVCADPNNLPFSNSAGAGFENKLAGFVAHIFGEKLAYTWWPQRRGFVRKTLKAHDCDVIMGVPTRLDMVETTRPYYRSTYVFVSRADSPLDISAITDPRLRQLRIGVQLIGNDGFNTPPAHALGEQGIVNNVTGFPVFGDYRQPNPPARIVKAVETGQVDIAAVWGPLAGYFAGLSPVKLRLQPITDTQQFAPLRFQFDISMGVRKGDDALKTRLDEVIAHHQPEIDAILKSYGVPLMPLPQSDTAQAGASASAN
jgi:quinoprotein dehydrogenase-associated probable ABC transporter substrate-binding protein